MVMTCAALPVCAQVASSPVSQSSPDVQIVALVLPTGTYAISSVYPKQVPEKEAQARITRLLKLTGWTAANRHFSNETAASNLLKEAPAAKLSAASFQTTANVINISDGTIEWEPFFRAFGDLPRVNIVFFTPPNFTYNGPQNFSSDRISLSVIARQGTVTGTANLLKPEPDPALFGLPKYATQAASVPTSTKKVVGNQAKRRLYGGLFAAFVGVIVALGIYHFARRFTTMPNVR